MRREPSLADVGSLLSIREAFRDARPQILHLHSAKAGLLGRLACHPAVPVIYTPHAFRFAANDSWAAPTKLVERALASRTTRLHAVSAAEARLAIESGLFPASKVIRIDNAVTVPLFAKRETSDSFVFGFLGELRAQKNPLLFLEAARELLRVRRGVRFLLPSVGALRGRIWREIGRLGLGTHFEEVTTDASLGEIIRRMDVGVLPSRYEGLPYAMLDALAAGKLVIGSNVPVLRDTLGQVAGDLVCELKPSEFAATMNRWADAPEEKHGALSVKARLLVERRFNIDSGWADSFVSMYEESLTEHARRFR